jgi:uncharacterized protein
MECVNETVIPSGIWNWNPESVVAVWAKSAWLDELLAGLHVKKCANTLTNKEKLCYYRRFCGLVLPMQASMIDIFEFCRLKEEREGEFAVADLTRLASEVEDKSGVLRWALQGGLNKFGHSQLKLELSGPVQLKCQRCLTAFAFSIESESTLVLATDEESADAIDELLDDDAIEVIVGSREFDIVRLIEDEALLALPLAPKHAVCPDNTTLDALKSVKKDSPFSVLKNLKQ